MSGIGAVLESKIKIARRQQRNSMSVIEKIEGSLEGSVLLMYFESNV
jgi:hypothetical protein